MDNASLHIVDAVLTYDSSFSIISSYTRPAPPLYYLRSRCSSEHRSWRWHRMERYGFLRSLKSLWPRLEPRQEIEHATAGKDAQPKCQLASIYDYAKYVDGRSEHFSHVSHHRLPTHFTLTHERIRARINRRRRRCQRKRNWSLAHFGEYKCPSNASVLLLQVGMCLKQPSEWEATSNCEIWRPSPQISIPFRCHQK